MPVLEISKKLVATFEKYSTSHKANKDRSTVMC